MAVGRRHGFGGGAHHGAIILSTCKQLTLGAFRYCTRPARDGCGGAVSVLWSSGAGHPHNTHHHHHLTWLGPLVWRGLGLRREGLAWNTRFCGRGEAKLDRVFFFLSCLTQLGSSLLGGQV